MEPIRLAQVPPPPGPRDEVRRITAGEEAHLCLISPALFGVWTHWDNSRTMPCLADKTKCTGCKNELPARWKGYLHALDLLTHRDLFLELTPLVAQLLIQNAPKNENFRGLNICISRGKGPKARLRLVVMVGRVADNQLPAPKDPEPVLRALWSTPDRRANSLADPSTRFSPLDNNHEQKYK